MQYLSVCSGIEAASVAWEPLGWQPIAFAEIAKFPRRVLSYHYPDVPLYGDFTTLRDEPWIGQANLLVGGTPCQSFSVAGLRGGLADARGNLTLEFVRLANAIDKLRPRTDPARIVWENVPGVLSSKDNAFGAFLAGLGGCDTPLTNTGAWPTAGVVAGPQRIVAWRVLDAQFFGVAQRRRRVFVLALGRSAPCGGWSVADALLPITDSVQRDLATRKATRQGSAGGATSGVDPNDRAVGTMTFAGGHSAGSMTSQDAASGLWAVSATAELGCDIAGTIRASGGGGDKAHAMVRGLVRRLTPTECERLQAFPDGYTAIPGAADGPRYQALGNSMCTSVVRWLAERIMATNDCGCPSASTGVIYCRLHKRMINRSQNSRLR